MLHDWAGRHIHDYRGYKMVYFPHHPNSWKSGMIFLHRLVMENRIGRLLKRGEVVHHKDGDPANNDPENLELCEDDSEHQRGHRSLQNRECLQCGRDFRPKKSRQKLCSVRCKGLANRKVKELPTKTDLKRLVWSAPSTDIAKKYGVSSKAVEKWCKKLGIEKPPRGYWTGREKRAVV